jgi:hypothetical protein
MDELLVGVRGRCRHRKGQCWRGDLLGQSLVRAKAVVMLAHEDNIIDGRFPNALAAFRAHFG